MYNVISILLIAAAAAFYARLSIANFYPEPGNSFWGALSWTRKYAYGENHLIGAPKNWYYTLFGIEYKERFPLSATALVWVTDGFHLMQFFMAWCISGAIVISHYNLLTRPWYWTLGYIVFYRLIWSGSFTLFFNFVFKK